MRLRIFRAGTVYINLDNVTHVTAVSKSLAGDDETIEVHFIGKSNEDFGSVWIDGEDAQRLLQLLGGWAELG